MGHGCARKVKGDSRAFGLSASEMALGKMVGGAGLGESSALLALAADVC